MIGDLSVLGLITARGGSLGVPRKNLREVGGRSLIRRAVESGLTAQCLDRVVLSSDDPEIIQAALLAGCDVPFVRPTELSTAEATTMAAVRHALETLEERYDLLVLLQPTSPFRSAEDIDRSVAHCIRSGAPACVSVTPPDKSPYWSYALDETGRMVPVIAGPVATRRQDLPQSYAVNGAVYVARCDWLADQDEFVQPETVGYVMPKERSIDIDDELDLVIAEAIWQHSQADSAPDLKECPPMAVTGALG